jgi:toxin YoeB
MSYQLKITKEAQNDIEIHKKTGNKVILKKIKKLLIELTDHPFVGTGKPEPLKHDFAGFWRHYN